jgi:radical SAM superfamily enzyme YgiQ (UPF0313 family)
MDITIILPTIRDEYGVLIKKKRATVPNLTIFYLAAFVPQGHNVTVIEEVVEDIDFDVPTDLVALSVLTLNSNRAYEIADEYRKRGVPLVMGGIHPSLLPDEAVEHADSVVIGEAEDTWPRLIDDFQRGSMRPIYREVKRESLANLPHPRYNLIKSYKYLRDFRSRSPIIPIQTSRGCPFDCDFCSVSRFWGRKVRYRPIEDVVQEILASYGKIFFFTDDNFLSNPERTMKICEAIKPLKIKWICQLDTLAYKHKEVVKAMADSGCFIAFLGFESLNPITLSGMNKNFSKPEKYSELFRIFSRYGIEIYASFIFGSDGDSAETVLSTMNFLVANKAKVAAFFPLAPYPGTELYRRMNEAGRLAGEKWWLSDDSERIKYGPNVKSGVELTRMAYKSFFSYPSILKRFFPPKKNMLLPLMYNLTVNKRFKKSDSIKAII